MDNDQAGFSSIDEYIAQCPTELQGKLQELRATIRAAAPQARERISYRMPAFAVNGDLVFFAVFKNHIGFNPTGSGVEAFKQELSAYKGSKGSVHFPLDQPIPLDLVTRIVKYRLAEDAKKTAPKAKK